MSEGNGFNPTTIIYSSKEKKEVTNSLKHYRLLGRSGLRVSPICLGTMNFGDKWEYTGKMKREDVEAIYDAYVSGGGNFIDTANKYHDGQSEEWLGDWLAKRGIRDELVIATKYSLSSQAGNVNASGNHRKNMFQAVEASLKRLKTHYIDLYYVHFWDYTTPVEEVLRALDDLVRSGKVHHIAISDAPAWVVAKGNTIADLKGWSQFVGYQGRYHVGSRDMEREIYPMTAEYNMAVLPWGVLELITTELNERKGKYTGKYKRGGTSEDTQRKGITMSEQDYKVADEVVKIASEIGKTPSQGLLIFDILNIDINTVCLNWALQKPRTIPIIGVRTLDMYKDNIGALDFTLSADAMKRLDAASNFEFGFPHDFLASQSYHNHRFLKEGGIIV